MSATRQLAAIMFTDIVGYTALMGRDEQKAFQLLEKTGNSKSQLLNNTMDVGSKNWVMG